MNNTNYKIASERTGTFNDKRHAHGKSKGHVSGDEWTLGVWNARGVNDLKVKELRETMDVKKLDILCVPETKKKGCETKDIKNGVLKGGFEIWSGVDCESHGKQGVGLILNERAKQHLGDHGFVSPRLLWARMKVGIRRLFIIACYAPVDSDPREVKDAFWDTLNDTINICEHGERIILLGDMNGWVGIQNQDTERVLGHFGDPRTNYNGDKLVGLCLERGLFITNTWFRHKMIHMYTWSKGNSRSIIDFVVADERLRELVKDTRVLRGPECNTDHYLLISKINLGRGWRKKRPKKAKQTRIKIENLQKPDVRIDFQNKIIESIDRATWEDRIKNKDLEGAWTMLRDILVRCTIEVCGTAVVGRMSGDAWWNDEIQAAQKAKREAYKRTLNIAGLSNEEISRRRNDYRRENRILKRLVKESKDTIRAEEEIKIQNDFEGSRKLLYKKMKGNKSTEIVNMRNSRGEMVYDADGILEAFRDYFRRQFGDEAIGHHNCDVEHDALENSIEKVCVTEVRDIIKNLKNGKAAGVDGINAEMLKHGGEYIPHRVCELINLCFEMGDVPDDWKEAIIVPIYKRKGDKSECNNYRGISLLSTVSKIYSKILIRRVMKITEAKIWEVQSGFMPGRSCTDQIFSLRQITEKSLRVGKKVFCAFVDLEKAFDKVDRSKLWEVLKEYGVNGWILQAIKTIYTGSKASVRVNGKLSDCFDIIQGVRQGCVMSSWLFILFMDKCLRMALFDEEGVDLETVRVRGLAFADDKVVMAESIEDLQRMLNKLDASMKSMGLKINANKTKTMVFEGKSEKTLCNILLNDERIEQVDKFVYLGSLFTRDGKIDEELDRRINEGKKVIGRAGPLIRSKNISNKAKMAIHNSIFVPTVLYGSETWTYQEKDKSKINAIDMRFMRIISGKSLMDKVSNEIILKECGAEETLVDTWERNRLRWFGHVERMPNERLTKQVYQGKVNGNVPRGRPRKEWLECVNETLLRRDIRSHRNTRACMKKCMDIKEAREVCQDRKVWRKIVNKKSVSRVNDA